MPLNDLDEFTADALDESVHPPLTEIGHGGGGGGHGGGGHGGHGGGGHHGGGGWRGRGRGGWGGWGPAWWGGPVYEGIEIDDTPSSPNPSADEIAEALAHKLKKGTAMGYDEIGVSVDDGMNRMTDAMGGNVEIGLLTPWDAFESEPMRIGEEGLNSDFVGYDEIGHVQRPGVNMMVGEEEIGLGRVQRPGVNMMMGGNVEIGHGFDEGVTIGDEYIVGNDEIGNDEIGAAVKKVIEKARDNRQPPPKMKAVDVDAPLSDDDDWALTDVCIGAAEVTGNPDPFPMTTALLLRFGAGGEPRVVRIDTEDSYKAFRTQGSPEMAALAHRVDEVTRQFAAHASDPEAHSRLAEDVEDLTEMGAEVMAAEDQKRVDLWLPKHFDGLVTAWIEGGNACASIALPGWDGGIRICTALEPLKKCVSEIARHASEANVPAATVVGVLPAMGAVLGAGTVIKELAAAAPSILQRPEASGTAPFVVRIEPKANPALCALAALAQECKAGNAQACTEWQALAAAGPAPVKQAMGEALALLKSAGV